MHSIVDLLGKAAKTAKNRSYRYPTLGAKDAPKVGHPLFGESKVEDGYGYWPGAWGSSGVRPMRSKSSEVAGGAP